MQIHSILEHYPLPALTGWILSQQNPNLQHRLCQSTPIDTIFRKFHPPLLHTHTLPPSLSSKRLNSRTTSTKFSMQSFPLSFHLHASQSRFLGTITTSYLGFFTLFFGPTIFLYTSLSSISLFFLYCSVSFSTFSKEGIFFIAERLSAERTTSLLHSDQWCHSICSTKCGDYKKYSLLYTTAAVCTSQEPGRLDCITECNSAWNWELRCGLNCTRNRHFLQLQFRWATMEHTNLQI